MAVNPLLSVYRANDPYEQLISAILAIESQPKLDLQAKKAEQERLKGVMNDFDSKLSALHSLLKTLTDPLARPFQGKSATTSATEFTVTASDQAALGTHTLEVKRLASADTRISKQYTSSGSTLRSFFDTNGAQTFTIRVASPTDTNPNNRVDIQVTVNPTGTTDEAILKEIATAINNAFQAAVDAGTIKSDERAYASVINETSSTARLSLRSGKTGFTYRLEFVDSAAGLLAALELNNNALATGTGGGQVTFVGTSETDSALNSQFVLDGLTLYRDANRVTDALTGITLEFKQVSTAPAEFTVAPDIEHIKAQIEDFIQKYNDVLTYITGKSNIDGVTETRGDFAGDPVFSGLRFTLRNEVVRKVSGQPTEGPHYITDLGITINDDGTLSLTDEDALLQAVRRNPQAVESLFSGNDGIATRLLTRLEAFVATGGIIDQRQDSIETRIRRLNDRIAAFEEQLARREEQLRAQFARVQETIALFQGQQQFLSGFLFGGGTFF
ncbi:flagellar filament capping protein FliD [Rhodothermus profundi]|uniref:Flagellar hook-associated protein 2 n=1 Tax=Rhodothermus profundi TaxID=633813 RepID=A0A1M6X7X2_9BACT|nr:flagellar filament capping protein FliD [Rhodothermus profundi]SHL02016.1 flagellar hook-associated protein 2 [Rhodothermus profundi]